MKKPVLWLISNAQSVERKKVAYTQAAEKVGFVVKSVAESSILGLEVENSSMAVHLNDRTTGKYKVSSLPDAVHSITGYSFSAPLASELYHQLELAGAVLINSSQAKVTANNKWWTHQQLLLNGVATPRTFYLDKQHESLQYVSNQLGFPLVVKASYGSKGQAVWLCHTFDEVVEVIGTLTSEREIIIQEYLQLSHGRDVRVVVVDGQVVGSMLRTAAKNGFQANLEAGGIGQPFVLTQAQAELAVVAAKAVGLGLAGVDLLFKNNAELVVGEVNQNPGLEIETFVGCDVAGAVMNYLWQQLA